MDLVARDVQKVGVTTALSDFSDSHKALEYWRITRSVETLFESYFVLVDYPGIYEIHIYMAFGFG